MQLSTNLPYGIKAAREHLERRGEVRLAPNIGGGDPVIAEPVASPKEVNPENRLVAAFLRATADKLNSKNYDAPLDQYVAAIVHRAEFLALADELDPAPTQPSVHCLACGMVGAAFEAPKVSGTFCNMACVETALFGIGKCRWCGSNMSERTYTSIESRLCGKDCSASYWDYVKGDRSAALGTGTRYRLWVQRLAPSKRNLNIRSAPAGDYRPSMNQ